MLDAACLMTRLLADAGASPLGCSCTLTWWRTHREGMDALRPVSTSGATVSLMGRGCHMTASTLHQCTSATAVTTTTTTTTMGAVIVSATTGAHASSVVCRVRPRSVSGSAPRRGMTAASTRAPSTGVTNAL